MASVKTHNRKKQTLVIEAKRGKLIVSPREADQILADLQIMYHAYALGIEVDNGGEKEGSM